MAVNGPANPWPARGERQLVDGTLLQRHAEIAAIGHAQSPFATGGYRQTERAGVLRAHRLLRIDGHLPLHRPALDQRPVVRLVGVFERTIAHQLGVQPAVAGKVDFFEEDAVESGTDPRAGPIDLNRQPGRRAEAHAANPA